MKKLLLISSFILLTASAFAQQYFIDKYEKIRNGSSDNEMFQVKRYDEKEVKELLKTHDNPEEVEQMKNVKMVFIGMDLDKEAKPDKKEFNNLVNQYEELLSFNYEGFDIKALAQMKKDKINDLIVIMNMNDAKKIKNPLQLLSFNMIMEVIFKNPISVDEWTDIAGDFSFNGNSLNDMMKGVTTKTSSFSETEGEEENEDEKEKEKESFDNLTIIKNTVKAQLQNDYLQYCSEFKIESLGGKYGLLFRGEVVAPYEYDVITAQKDNMGYITKQGGKYGIIGIGFYHSNVEESSKKGRSFPIKNGKDKLFLHASVVPCEFDKIEFDSGRFYVTKNNLKGIYSISGASIMRCEFDDIKIENGRFYVRKGNQTGIYTLSGANIMRCEFEDIKIENGRYFVRKGNQTGIYSMSGASIMRCDNYDYIKIENGRYSVGMGGKHGIYSMSGASIMRCEFEDIKIENGRYFVRKDNHTGIYSMSGASIMRCEFDDIKTVGGRYWVKKGKQKGVYTLSGATILNCDFDKIEQLSDGKFVAYKNGKKDIYSSSGSRISTDYGDVVYSTD